MGVGRKRREGSRDGKRRSDLKVVPPFFLQFLDCEGKKLDCLVCDHVWSFYRILFYSAESPIKMLSYLLTSIAWFPSHTGMCSDCTVCRLHIHGDLALPSIKMNEVISVTSTTSQQLHQELDWVHECFK